MDAAALQLIADRLDEIERRITSDLGDGRSKGNITRQLDQVAEALAASTKALKTLVADTGTRFDERLDSMDLRASDAAKELASARLSIETCQNSSSKAEERMLADRKAMEDLRSAISEQQAMGQSRQNTIDELVRKVGAATDRLDGKGFLQAESYERVVNTVREHTDLLRGGEGQLSYPQVRNSIERTQFLGAVIKAMIGVFGVGTLTTAGFALFGGKEIAPEVQALDAKVQEVRADLIRLESEWRADVRDRLRQKPPN